MLNKIWKELAIMLLIAGGVWYTFTVIDIFPDKNLVELSVAQEEDLAEYLTAIFDKTFPNVEDSTALDALDVVVERLMAHLAPTEYEYRFHLVENPDVNAFATLGGNIYIFSGLMKFTESPEELAAVLAHEIGHCEEKHVVHSMGRELGMSILVSIMGGDPGLAQELYRSIISNVFSRSQEAEADEFSFELLERSGIAPSSLATFFRRINLVILEVVF